MKKINRLLCAILSLLCVFTLSSCRQKQSEKDIKIIVPAGSTEKFAYSDEEISPLKNKVTIYSGEGLGDTEVVLEAVEVSKTTEYKPTYLTHGMPVEMDVEKGGWYKIGVNIQNPTDEDITVHITVENVNTRKENSEESYVKLDFDAQYIRTNGEHNGVEHFIIRSKEELDTYYEQNKNKHNLERRENPASDNTIGFLDACDKYDKKFFEDNALIMILLEEGSGSTRHKVTEVSVTRPEMSLLAAKVKIDSIVPEVGTCDMAGWHILISVKKEDIHKDLDFISIYYDDKLANGDAGYCGNTQTTIHFDEENSHTFMGSQSVALTDMLRNLDYDPDKICKCLPEYMVDTEFGTGYGINLTEGYARYNGGQVDLTKEQLEQITDIINWAKKEANYIASSTESIKAIQVASAEDNKFYKLKGDDVSKVKEILSIEGDWDDGMADCLGDCFLMIGDIKYGYHSDCGTLNDSAKIRSKGLDEESKKTLNAILSKYIDLDK